MSHTCVFFCFLCPYYLGVVWLSNEYGVAVGGKEGAVCCDCFGSCGLEVDVVALGLWVCFVRSVLRCMVVFCRLALVFSDFLGRSMVAPSYATWRLNSSLLCYWIGLFCSLGCMLVV